MSENKLIPPEIDKLTGQLVLDPKSKVFAQLADSYRRIGMDDEAIETCKRGIEHNPDFVTGHLVLGRCYLSKKMYALAVEAFQEVLRKNPQNLSGYKLLATAYEEQGQNSEAIKYYQRILDLEPGQTEIGEQIEKLRSTPA
jgi:tetratricopeptide (TPR) repeat protein